MQGMFVIAGISIPIIPGPIFIMLLIVGGAGILKGKLDRAEHTILGIVVGLVGILVGYGVMLGIYADGYPIWPYPWDAPPIIKGLAYLVTGILLVAIPLGVFMADNETETQH